MRKILLFLFTAGVCMALLSSCVETRRNSNCPSHDPNYWSRRK